MRGLYQHDCAKDSYIDILKAFAIKPGVWKVKCKLYTYLSPAPWQTVTFRMTREQYRFWKPINNPRI